MLHAAGTGECYRSGDRDRLPEFRVETKPPALNGSLDASAARAANRADDDAVVLYTSGTTARHKV